MCACYIRNENETNGLKCPSVTTRWCMWWGKKKHVNMVSNQNPYICLICSCTLCVYIYIFLIFNSFLQRVATSDFNTGYQIAIAVAIPWLYTCLHWLLVGLRFWLHPGLFHKFRTILFHTSSSYFSNWNFIDIGTRCFFFFFPNTYS